MRAADPRLLALVSIAALAGARIVALGADPPPWLSWSGGIATDEGFYTLDARHMVLFGTWARGDFHDRLLSPALSVLQQGVFALLGAGLVQARAIDAVLGFLTIGLLWLGLRASCGTGAANAGALLLGFAPPFVLYNRMALQETPAAFCLTLSFALWALAMRPPRSQPAGQERTAPRPPILGEHDKESRTGIAAPLSPAPAPRNWGGGASVTPPNSGAGGPFSLPDLLLMTAGAAAGLAFMCKGLAIVFLPALGWAAVRSGRRVGSMVGGAALVLALYGMIVYAPHHAEMARMGRYYGQHQFAPHSVRSLWLNIRRAGLGDRAGALRGMMPYLLLFLPVPCLLAATQGREFAAKPLAEQALWLWLAGGTLFCAVSSYAPDRYYVLFLPALCGVAGIGFASLAPAQRQTLGLAACLVNGLWLGAAWHGRTWTAQTNARTLSRLLPARSVVVGDMAPAACLGTTLDAAPVQPGLSSSVRPVETLGAGYVAATRAPAVMAWWRARYPQIVQRRRPVASLPVGTHRVVDIYKVRP